MIQHRRLAGPGWIPVMALVLMAGCASVPPRLPAPEVAALPPGADTRLDRSLGKAEAAHPGQSGFILLGEGPEAFVARLRSAELAERSLDVQTYIWHDDATGAYLALALLEAADRGVRVRLLIDDLDGRAKNAGLAALAAHPGIEVRMFNPFKSREGTLGLAAEFAGNFGRLNHRMHNKTWIADNRVAIAGGRNLGDEYFGASDELNFVDLDFLMLGPIVREASASFDRYWNSPAAYPIEELAPDIVTQEALAALRVHLADLARSGREGRYAQALARDEAVQALYRGERTMQWSPKFELAADDPLKATLDEDDPERSAVLAAIGPAMKSATNELSIISPYFVPGKGGTERLVAASQSGVRVRIITNSLAANDVAAVHGGYSRYRKALLEGGVELYELKPIAGRSSNSSLFGSSGASLHTKAFIVDDRTAFVGSFNLDPRSAWLNCEQGVLVEDGELSDELLAIFARQSDPSHAWRVSLDGGEMKWSDGQQDHDRDPDASAGRRFVAWFSRVLHLDAQL